MRINTTRFGRIDVDAGDILRFPSGLPGLEDCREWALLADADGGILYVDEVNLPMQERMPNVATCKLKSGWASLYDTCSADHNAIVGWHDEHPGLLLQVGYSGHGAMESPAVGIGLAELVLTGRYQTIDCTPLRWSRFREGDLVHEKIVI